MKNFEMEVEKIISGYCKIFGEEKTIENFETEILSLRNPQLSYYFIKNINGANKEMHEEVIRSYKNLKNIENNNIESNGKSLEEYNCKVFTLKRDI